MPINRFASALDDRLLCPSSGRPHVVILGAGASRAAFPKGCADGRPIPLMGDLVDVLELQPQFEEAGINVRGCDFEKLYSMLASDGSNDAIRAQIEDRVFEYFSSLRLPPGPTLYDHLILSLRSKDLIATFNWDPFLWEALNRTFAFTDHPHIVHLHGNVAIGHCAQHDRILIGRRGRSCPRCGAKLTPSTLLYPIEKNYSGDSGVSSSWKALRSALQDANALTIFGYSAPQSDVEAIKLMRELWRSPHPHNAEVDIIDIRDEESLYQLWSPFFDGPHYGISSSFYDSRLSRFPRRTSEAHLEASFNLQFLNPTRIPLEASWNELRSWFAPILNAEKEQELVSP